MDLDLSLIPPFCVTSLQSRVDFGLHPFVLSLFSFPLPAMPNDCSRLLAGKFSALTSCHVRRELCGLRLPAEGRPKVVVVNTSEWKTFTRSGPNMLEPLQQALRSDLRTDPPSGLMQSSWPPTSSPAGMNFACPHKCSFQKGACRRDIALIQKQNFNNERAKMHVVSDRKPYLPAYQ